MEWYVFAIGAAIFSAAFQILRKKALLKCHALNFESARTMYVVMIALVLLPFLDWSFDKSALIIVYIVSFLAAIGILFAAKAYRHNDISLISPLSNLRPAFVAIIAFIFLSESLGYKQIAGILIILVSAYILESNHHFSNIFEPLKHMIKSKYTLYFIFAMFLFSITAVLDKFVISTKITHVYTYFFLLWLFLAINLNIIHGLRYGLNDTIKYIKKATYLPFFVALASVLANLLMLKALSLEYVSLVIPIVLLSTLLVTLLGGKFFHEKNLVFRVIISIFMLIGAYLIII